MNRHPSLPAAALAVVLVGAAVPAAAGLPMTLSDAQGTPGSVVFPRATVHLPGSHDLEAMLFGWEYDAAVLEFVPTLAKVQVLAREFTLEEFVSQLQGIGQVDAFDKRVNPGNGREFYRYTFFSLMHSLRVGQDVTFVGAFRVKDTAPLGQPLAIEVAGDVGAGDLEDDFGGVVNVSAVPEPHTWLLWLAGMGLLAWRGQRRAG